jgi:hypothetical protein
LLGDGKQQVERELDERALRARANSSTNTDYIKKLENEQARRLKWKIRLTFLVIMGIVTLLTSIYFGTRNQPTAAKKLVEVATLIDAGDFNQALLVSGEVLELGNYEWYAQLYTVVALIELGEYGAANVHADKLAAIFEDEDALPEQFLPIYLLAKKLGGDFEQAILPLQAREMPLYVERAIQTVQIGRAVCFPLISSTKRLSAYGTYKQKKCLMGR